MINMHFMSTQDMYIYGATGDSFSRLVLFSLRLTAQTYHDVASEIILAGNVFVAISAVKLLKYLWHKVHINIIRIHHELHILLFWVLFHDGLYLTLHSQAIGLSYLIIVLHKTEVYTRHMSSYNDLCVLYKPLISFNTLNHSLIMTWGGLAN